MIVIDGKLKALIPDIALATVAGEFLVQKKDENLWQEIKKQAVRIKADINDSSLYKLPEIKALRNGYKSLGKDPNRYRGSAEALIRRVISGKDLYQINTVVDINNLVSLISTRSVGVYNLDQLQPPLIFRIGTAGEKYFGIGKEEINIAELPVFSDQNGPFGSPTSDSRRSMIMLESVNIMMVIISFSGDAQLAEQANMAANFLETYCAAIKSEIKIKIIE